MNNITGQLFFRSSGKESPLKDGRQLMMTVGVLAMPDDSLSEKQLIVSGNIGDPIIKLEVFIPGMIDLTNHPRVRGNSLGNLILQPIWRV